MTKFPTESRDVVGLSAEEWPQEYKVGPYCSVPSCGKPADHAHHLFSRGMMGGAFDWVRLPDGSISANKVALCFAHHELVTNNEVAILYEPSANGDGVYVWADPTKPRQILTPQPAVVGPGGSNPVVSDNGHPHEERAICPTCERPLPRPKIESGPEAPRERKTWAVSVPADHWEDGADVLDALLESSRDELDKVGLSYGEGKKVKYAILSTALALFVQHAAKILADA